MIYHVTDKETWEKALNVGYYADPSLEKEGFIHMSKENQVEGVLERYFKNRTNLVKLHVDETILLSELRYDWSPSVQEEFPHVYGTINLNAVVKVDVLN